VEAPPFPWAGSACWEAAPKSAQYDCQLRQSQHAIYFKFQQQSLDNMDSGNTFVEKPDPENVADEVIHKAKVSLAEKGKIGLGQSSHSALDLPTTDAISDKVLKEGVRKLAHEESELASDAQVILSASPCCEYCRESPCLFVTYPAYIVMMHSRR